MSWQTELTTIAALGAIDDQLQVAEMPAEPGKLWFELRGRLLPGMRVLSRLNGPADPVGTQRPFPSERHHQVALWLPGDYPAGPPEIEWLSDIYHPNVLPGARMQLPDVGLDWDPPLNLTVIAERLWDIARGAYWQAEDAVHPAVVRNLSGAYLNTLPTDGRKLADSSVRNDPKVIRYRWK